MYCIVLYCIVLYCIVSYCICLLLAECEVRTACFGPSFFLPFMAQARSARTMKTRKEKREFITCRTDRANEADGVFIKHSKTSFEKNCFSAWASTLNMGLINKVDMVCLSPVGYGV